jgi:hypothetical protein
MTFFAPEKIIFRDHFFLDRCLLGQLVRELRIMDKERETISRQIVEYPGSEREVSHRGKISTHGFEKY